MRHESLRAAFEVVSVGSKVKGYTTLTHTRPDTATRIHSSARVVASKGTLAVTSLQPIEPLHGRLVLMLEHPTGGWVRADALPQVVLQAMVRNKTTPEGHRVVQMQGEAYRILHAGPSLYAGQAQRSLGNAQTLSKGQIRKMKRKAK